MRIDDRRGGAHDLELFVFRRMVDDDVEHEAIELRFRERIRAFELDRVLGGKDVERLLERVGASLDGDPMLLHGLEQRRLRLRRRAVDLVGEDDVAENRTGCEHHLAAAGAGVLLDDVGAGDVGRHQVGRELDARELQVEDLGQGLDEQGLRETGDADDEAVAADEEGLEDELDDVALSDDPLAELLDDGFAAGVHPIGQCDVVRGIEIRGFDVCHKWSFRNRALGFGL